MILKRFSLFGGLSIGILLLMAGFLLLVFSKQTQMVKVDGDLNLTYSMSSLDLFATRITVTPVGGDLDFRFAETTSGRHVVEGILSTESFDVVASPGDVWKLDVNSDHGLLEISSLHYTAFLPGLVLFVIGLVVVLIENMLRKR